MPTSATEPVDGSVAGFGSPVLLSRKFNIRTSGALPLPRRLWGSWFGAAASRSEWPLWVVCHERTV